ncbi:MAG TPA: hypothetical protein VGK74_17560 [Symbiobacteriaceae bacterium]|jgi:hypothetical protein
MSTQSPKATLDQFKQQCETTKTQLSGQLNQIPDPQARTAVQMAINAVDHCIAQCHTATGAVQ